jgi:hypothetical protein
MPIDPRLYQKYTGKMPGEAMTRYGESLAKQSARGPAGDTSFMGSMARGRWMLRVGIAVVVLVVVLVVLLRGRMI